MTCKDYFTKVIFSHLSIYVCLYARVQICFAAPTVQFPTEICSYGRKKSKITVSYLYILDLKFGYMYLQKCHGEKIWKLESYFLSRTRVHRDLMEPYNM